MDERCAGVLARQASAAPVAQDPPGKLTGQAAEIGAVDAWGVGNPDSMMLRGGTRG